MGQNQTLNYFLKVVLKMKPAWLFGFIYSLLNKKERRLKKGRQYVMRGKDRGVLINFIR